MFAFNPPTKKLGSTLSLGPLGPVLRGRGAIQQLKAQTETFPAVRHILNDLTAATGHRCHGPAMTRCFCRNRLEPKSQMNQTWKSLDNVMPKKCRPGIIMNPTLWIQT